METIDVLKLLADAPLTLMLLYLLLQEQRRHAETRQARDADNRDWMERHAALADRVAVAVERLDLPSGRPFTD